MGNIVGEKFENYVLTQIAARQNVYGSGYAEDSIRTPQQLQLINNKSAWLKMASSTTVLRDETPAIFNKTKGEYIDASISKGEKRLKNIGINNTANFTGTKLAEQTVLFNTLSTVNPTTKYNPETGVGVDGSYNFRSGVSKTNSLWNSNNTYGLGGTDQGLVPAPGLLSFGLDSQNRGSIRKGTIELKCYNKFQFELIELVYLRLGYTMMVEWGWDKYTTNGKTIKDVGNTIIEDQWFQSDNNTTQLEMIKIIEKYRKLYAGNYDGFYGRVTNFTWSFEADGTYNISIDLISIGDVIESLKVSTKNISLTLDQIAATTGSNEDTFEGLSKSPIVVNAGNTSLSQDMFQDILKRDWAVSGGSEYFNPSIVMNLKSNGNKRSSDGSTDKYSYFMTFGELIKKLKTFCIPKLQNEFGVQSDIITFDSGVDENLCATFPNHISLDPRVCLIKPALAVSTIVSAEKTYVINDPGWNYSKQFAFTEDQGNVSTVYGKIMNIYLNYDFISTLLDNATEGKDKKTISIFSFLQSICNGINDSLGNINNLEVVLKDDSIITIVEQNAIPGQDQLKSLKGRMSAVPSFDIFGMNPNTNTSGFVTDFTFDTKITPELASMISIGATAAGTSTKDYDATAFSKWNEGLYDRFNKKFIDPAVADALSVQLALSDQANELGITAEDEITSLQGVVLYNAWNAGELDRGDDEVFSDFISFTNDTITQTVDAVAEVVYDGWNWLVNKVWRDDDEQVDISKNNVGNLTADDYFMDYTQNRTFTAMGVENRGYRIAEVNSVYPLEGDDTNGGLNWAEYIAQVNTYLYQERMKKITGKLTPEELASKFANNYILYLTEVFGGDFAAGSNDGKTGQTKYGDQTYWQYNSAEIKRGKNSFEAYVTTINNSIFAATGKPSGTIGFIPITFAITFEGLSGIKIYNQIDIRQGFLPSQYPQALKFLISTVNHKIEGNKWESSLDTVSIPRTFATGKFKFSELATSADTYSSGGGKGLKENPGPAPNADTVRDYIAPIPQFEEKKSGSNGGGGYTQGLSGGELSSGGDITEETATMIITILKTIRVEEPNIRVTLTGGNDLYHKNKLGKKDYVSRHEGGTGIDFTINNPSASNLAIIIKILGSYAVGNKNWYYIDEYGEPTKVATGGHFHISNPTAEPGSKKGIRLAEKQLAAGEITKRP